MWKKDDIIMKTNLLVIDGKITYPLVEKAPSLLDIKPTEVEDGGFVFYDKKDSEKEICKIAYTEASGKNELRYETKPDYRRKGYMTKAMILALEWMRQHSVKGCLWLLISKNNVPSQKIAQRFDFIPVGCFNGEQEWYCLDLENLGE